MGQPVVHWEIAAKDAKKTQEFYAKLFDWTINVQQPMNYGLVKTGGEGGIDGGIYGTENGRPPSVTFYVGVDDLEASLDPCESFAAPLPARGFSEQILVCGEQHAPQCRGAVQQRVIQQACCAILLRGQHINAPLAKRPGDWFRHVNIHVKADHQPDFATLACRSRRSSNSRRVN
jgi:hypothetical protein